MSKKSLAAQLIEIITPRRIVLSGLYLGPAKPKNIYIFYPWLIWQFIFSSWAKHVITRQQNRGFTF